VGYASYLPVVGEATGVVLVGERAGAPKNRVGELFDQHHRRLYRLARRLTTSRGEAQDLVQETFLRVVRSPNAVPVGPTAEEAWLVRVLVNVCRDQWRRKSSRRRLDEKYRPVGEQAGTRHPETALIARSIVWRALQDLAPRRRMVIILYELEGVGISEIARLLGVSAITVRWHLSRARKELACIILKDEESRI
jgi:RNA polymerase sigma-70 factor (ECF subfamily)